MDKRATGVKDHVQVITIKREPDSPRQSNIQVKNLNHSVSYKTGFLDLKDKRRAGFYNEKNTPSPGATLDSVCSVVEREEEFVISMRIGKDSIQSNQIESLEKEIKWLRKLTEMQRIMLSERDWAIGTSMKREAVYMSMLKKHALNPVKSKL